MNGRFSMKTQTMSSKQLESENNMSLPEYPKQWKSRLQRFQSSLRKSLRLKKGTSPRSASFASGGHRVDPANDHQNCLVNYSSNHVKREIFAKEPQNGVSHKQLNGMKTSSHSHHRNGKTSFDSYGFDNRKFEQNKTNSNNNRKKKKNSTASTSSIAANERISELPICGHEAPNHVQKKTQTSKRQRAKTNTEKTSLSKSKSLSILTNLFKRSSHSKDKDNRGKSSSFAAPQSWLSNDLSIVSNTLVTDIVVSNSSIDSCCDNDSRHKDSKYLSLKRSKRSPVYPNSSISRSLSMDNSLQPCADSLMEKSRTLAAIPPCIRVEEYHENRGVFERSLTVEFNPGSSGSVTIETGPVYYQSMTGSPCSCGEKEVVDSFSSGTPKSGVEFETGRNITRDAERSRDAWKRRSAPPILSNFADKNSPNIGSPIFFELNTDIATEEEGSSQFERDSHKGQSSFSEGRKSSSQTVDCAELTTSDMGNNLSYGIQKPRKFNSKDAKFKLAFLRSIKRTGKNFNEKSDGEEDPIIEQPEYMECFERELERRNYLANNVCLPNEPTKDKSNSLCEGTEPLGLSEKMIDIFHKNNYSQDFSAVKSTALVINGGSQPTEIQTAEENTTYENTRSLPNDKVNKEEIVCEQSFCSSTFGQTEGTGSSQQGVCLSCRKTRNELTSTELTRCSRVLTDPSKTNYGTLDEVNLRDRISSELITCGLREICNGGHGLARNLKVNSLPSSPVEPSIHIGTMYNSFPDIRKLHIHNLSQKLLDTSDSLSSCSLHVESSFENDSIVENSGQKTNSSLYLHVSKCEEHGGVFNHLSPESPEERQRSQSARVTSRSPIQQVLQTESRSVSCSQLDKSDDDNPISCTSPPYVRPRIQSLEQLPPCTAEVILRKKRSIIRKTRMKHTTSLPFVDNVFNDIIDKGKRHSYGGYGDVTFLQLPNILQRSHSAESQLDSCNSSMQSLNSSSSFTENDLGSTFSFTSQLSLPGAFDKSLGLSRSVPGLLGIDNPQPSPIPEEHPSVDWTSLSAENSDNGDEEDDEVRC